MRYFLVISSLLFLSACQNGMLMTRGDIREQEQSKNTVSTIQKANADSTNRFNEIEQDLRALNGRVEVAESRTQALISERQQMKNGYDALSNEQSKKILILQEEMAKLQDQLAQLNAEMNAVRTAGSSNSNDNVSDRSAPKDAFQVAEESFDKKDWKKAILNYNKYRDSNPKSKKFGEATYKIGVSFQELGMKDEAKTFYEEVIGKFPNSSDAKKAKTRLKSLKR